MTIEKTYPAELVGDDYPREIVHAIEEWLSSVSTSGINFNHQQLEGETGIFLELTPRNRDGCAIRFGIEGRNFPVLDVGIEKFRLINDVGYSSALVMDILKAVQLGRVKEIPWAHHSLWEVALEDQTIRKVVKTHFFLGCISTLAAAFGKKPLECREFSPW